MDSGPGPEPVIGRRFAPTRWGRPGMTTERFTPKARSARSNLNRVDRAVLDLRADMGVQAWIAARENLDGGQHGIGWLEHRHHRYVARGAQGRPDILGKLP